MQSRIKQIKALLQKGKIQEGLDILEELISKLSRREHSAEFIQISARYHTFLKGIRLHSISESDTKKEQSQIIAAIIDLLEELPADANDLAPKFSSHLQSTNRHIENVGEFRNTLGQLSVKFDLNQMPLLEKAVEKRSQLYDSFFGEYEQIRRSDYNIAVGEKLILFDRIVTNSPLSAIDYKDIDEIRSRRLTSPRAVEEKILIVRAITLSLVNRFDPDKFSLLIDFLNGFEDKVWHNSLAGIVLILYKNDRTISGYPSIVERLEKLKQIPEIQEGLEPIFAALLEGKTTKKPPKEILNHQHFNTRKGYWFLPLSEHNPFLQSALEQSNLNFNKQLFSELICSSTELTNLEKYDICLALPSFSQAQIDDLCSRLLMEQRRIIRRDKRVSEKIKFKSLINNFYDFIKYYSENELPGYEVNQDVLSASKLIDFIVTQTFRVRIRGVIYYYSNQYETAITYYSKHLQLQPHDARSLSQIGYAYVEMNNYEEGLKYHLRSVEIEPEDAWNLRVIGFVYGKLNNYKESLKYYLRSAEIEPEDAWTLRQIGFAYVEMNNYEEGLKYHLRSVEIEPEDAWTLRQIGFVYGKMNNYKEGLKYHLRSAEIEPDHAWNLRQIGFAYMHLANYEEGLKYYLRSIEIEPNDAWTLRQIGFAYLNLEDYEECLKYHLRSAEIEPDDAWTLRQIGFAHGELGNHEEGLKYHLRSAEIEPNDAWTLRLIGLAHGELDNYEEGLKYYLRSAEIEPDDAWTLRRIGFAHGELGNYEEGLKYHLRSEEIEPKNAWNLRRIGRVYRELGNYKEGLKYHLKSEEIEPEHTWNLSQIALAYYEMGELTNCDNYLKKTLNLNENKKYLNVGWVLFVMGKMQESKDNFLKGFEVIEKPGYNDYMNMGHVLLCLGDNIASSVYYKKSIEGFSIKKFRKDMLQDYQYIEKYVSREFFDAIIEEMITYKLSIEGK